MKTSESSAFRGPLDGVVRVQALRLYSEVVAELGGNASKLLALAQIDAGALTHVDALISYRSMIHLLELTSVGLKCPDFGLRLASSQGGIAVLGPLEIAMRNSSTVGEAYRYCAGHLQVYSPVVRIQIEEHKATGRHFMRFEILLNSVSNQRQAVENALGAVLTLSRGSFGAREVWFTHERLMPLSVYRRYFDGPVKFGKPFNAMFFNSRDLARPIPDKDPQLYELAASYIDTRFPAVHMNLVTRVHTISKLLLEAGLCTHIEVAARLNMHPRTLQRHLRKEKTSFGEIKDDVRRDAAARYLKQSQISLTQIATMLGYSEPSVLTRSCRRWFASTPRRIRESYTEESIAAL